MTLAVRLREALASPALAGLPPVETALILGSGLGSVADAVEVARAVPYGAIGGFPVSTAPGHAGRLLLGRLHGHAVAVMQGRVHPYEGHAPQDIALAVHLLKGLGARRLVVTNAAGGLSPDLRPGDVMLILDHLNLTGLNPLTGPNDEALGPRFPDLTDAHDPRLLQLAREAAARAGEALKEGIYAGIAGPSLETRAERRWLRATGADAVGMSTVHEVIAAAHAGLPVLGLSAITNAATGGPEQRPDTIEAVLAEAARCGARIGRVLRELMPTL